MNLKTSFLLLLISVSVQISFAQELKPRIKTRINESWSFRKIQSENTSESTNKETVNLPHSWNVDDPFDDNLGNYSGEFDDDPGYYRGKGEYIKTLDLSSYPKNKKVYIYFEAANQVTTVFINDKLVGEHIGGYTGFCFDITPYVNYKKDVLKVIVNNEFNMAIPPLRADFNFYGGIYRDVYLISTSKTHFDMMDYGSSGVYIHTSDESDNQATVHVEGIVVNEEPVKGKITAEIQIFDSEGNKVAETVKKLDGKKEKQVFNVEMPVKNPKLWSPDSPYMYSVLTRVKSGGQVYDEIAQPLGIRWFKFDPDEGLILNGEHVKLIGANRHQDFPGKANALTDEEHIRDLKLLDDMGANFLRPAHYPQDPTVLEAADRMGFVVTMEIPLMENVPDNREFQENSKKMMLEMIKQYYNHPSIFIWTYMNEMLMGNLTEERIERTVNMAKEIDALIRKEDPNRYTMIPNHANFEIYHEAGLTKIPMIVGWNVYYGWYVKEFEVFSEFAKVVHDSLPDKAIIITEYGAGADPRIRSEKPIRYDFSVEWENKFHAENLHQIKNTPYIAGATVWNMFDFGSERRGDAVPYINNKGLCSFDRIPKDPYFLYKAALSKEPAVLFSEDLWGDQSCVENTKEGKSIRSITVFSNTENVELFLDGVSQGTKAVEKNMVQWEVPFHQGKNVLVAKSVNNEGVIDHTVINYDILPEKGTLAPTLFSMNMGGDFQFRDKETENVWIPEKEFTEGSWGYVGGKQYLPRSRGFGVPNSIFHTENDPIFQTQRTGIEELKLKLKSGVYQVNLCFAELEKDNVGERVFSVVVNDEIVLKDLDIFKGNGKFGAVVKTVEVFIENEEMNIQFIPVIGEPVLNGIQILKK